MGLTMLPHASYPSLVFRRVLSDMLSMKQKMGRKVLFKDHLHHEGHIPPTPVQCGRVPGRYDFYLNLEGLPTLSQYLFHISKQFCKLLPFCRKPPSA